MGYKGWGGGYDIRCGAYALWHLILLIYACLFVLLCDFLFLFFAAKGVGIGRVEGKRGRGGGSLLAIQHVAEQGRDVRGGKAGVCADSAVACVKCLD